LGFRFVSRTEARLAAFPDIWEWLEVLAGVDDVQHGVKVDLFDGIALGKFAEDPLFVFFLAERSNYLHESQSMHEFIQGTTALEERAYGVNKM
jgi:hypothetical protein